MARCHAQESFVTRGRRAETEGVRRLLELSLIPNSSFLQQLQCLTDQCIMSHSLISRHNNFRRHDIQKRKQCLCSSS